MKENLCGPSNQDLQNQIAANTNYVVKEINSVHRHIDQTFAPPRRKKTSHGICCSQSGELLFTQYYDITPPECFYIFSQTTGPCTIYKVNTADVTCMRNLFLIYFDRDKTWIIGDVDKLSEKYLYELFLQHKIPFNLNLPRSKVQRSLYEFFKPLIISCKNTITIPGLAGWYKQRFHHGDNIAQSPVLKKLPIVDKKLEAFPLEKCTFTYYKAFLEHFNDYKTRLMITIYPIASLLSSIFKEYRGNLNFSLNLVPTMPLNITDVADYFQVFSHEKLYACRSSDSQKNLEKTLLQTKDEIFLMDMRLPSENDYYRKKQRDDRFDFVCSVLSGRTNIAGQYGNSATAGLVTISDEIILKANVFNILTSSEFNTLSTFGEHTTKFFKERKIMSRIYCQFVRFIEDMKDDFFATFTQNTVADTHSGAILEITFHLFCDFWRKQNIEFAKELGFPENIDFDDILLPEAEFGDEDVSIFIERVKNGMAEYRVLPKRNSDASDKCIFYDDTQVYFPISIMENICACCGIKNYKKLLIKLRNQNILLASQDRLTKQIVIHCNTFSCYVLHRESFEKTGELEISLIGKEN